MQQVRLPEYRCVTSVPQVVVNISIHVVQNLSNMLTIPSECARVRQFDWFCSPSKPHYYPFAIVPSHRNRDFPSQVPWTHFLPRITLSPALPTIQINLPPLLSPDLSTHAHNSPTHTYNLPTHPHINQTTLNPLERIQNVLH
jgi:hypothetical protein